MFSRFKNFISRHRRKFLISGLVIGGSVLLVRYAQRKLQEFQEAQTKEIAEKFKRMQHFESTERTCNQTIQGLTPTLADRISKELDTGTILEKLRQNPDNKLDLWEELKIVSFSKIATLVYATSMLVVTLRVQLNILGGYVYKDTIVSDNKSLTVDLQTMYLSLIQYLMSDGLTKLIELIQKNVVVIMKRYNLKQKLTLADTETLFWSIQMAVNNEADNPIKNLAKFVMPTEVNGNEILNKMYIETLDVLESPEVTDLCMSNASQGFSSVIDKIAEFYIEPVAGPSSESMSKSMLNAGFMANINKIDIPLAKLIPIVNGIASKKVVQTIDDPNPDLVSSLIALYLLSDKIKMLGANVYEAFCQ